MTAAIICTALLGLLLFALGMGVSLTRQRSERGIGFDQDPSDPLHKIVRSHGNTAEYAPMLAILIMTLGALNPAAWMIWLMVAVVGARYLIAVGLMIGSLENPNPARFLGALGTYLGGLALCVAIFLSL